MERSIHILLGGRSMYVVAVLEAAYLDPILGFDRSTRVPEKRLRDTIESTARDLRVSESMYREVRVPLSGEAGEINGWNIANTRLFEALLRKRDNAEVDFQLYYRLSGSSRVMDPEKEFAKDMAKMARNADG